MTRLGIVAALPGEIRALTGKSIPFGTVYRLADNLLLVWSGVGPQRARAAAERLLMHQVTTLLSWGCAAALDERLTPGSLVVPGSVVASDATTMAVDPGWQARLHTRLAGRFLLCTGALAESRTILSTPAQKHLLAARTHALAADMESAALGILAQEAGVAFGVVRAIADSVNMAVPRMATRAIDERGQLRPAGLIAGLILFPREWRTLVQLGRGFRTAMATLTGVAATILDHPDCA